MIASIKPKEFHERYPECFGESVEGSDGEVDRTRFNLLKISIIETEILQCFLRKSSLLSEKLNASPKKAHEPFIGHFDERLNGTLFWQHVVLTTCLYCRPKMSRH